MVASKGEREASSPLTVEAKLDDRRELLKKLGRLGLYTAPAMLIAFETSKAQVVPSGPDGNPPNQT